MGLVRVSLLVLDIIDLGKGALVIMSTVTQNPAQEALRDAQNPTTASLLTRNLTQENLRDAQGPVMAKLDLSMERRGPLWEADMDIVMDSQGTPVHTPRLVTDTPHTHDRLVSRPRLLMENRDLAQQHVVSLTIRCPMKLTVCPGTATGHLQAAVSTSLETLILRHTLVGDRVMGRHRGCDMAATAALSITTGARGTGLPEAAGQAAAALAPGGPRTRPQTHPGLHADSRCPFPRGKVQADEVPVRERPNSSPPSLDSAPTKDKYMAMAS